MKNIHVCLVSDQTIPNILAIHHFQPDELLLVTTPEMERRRKGAHILAALSAIGLDFTQRHSTITVPEESLLDAHRSLEEWTRGREDAEFVVNLTCGTKIMAIAAYEFFKDYGARMIYIPLPKNEFIIPFPKRHTGKPVPLALRLDVSAYLAAYGLQVINAKSLDKGRRDSAKRKELSLWVVQNYPELKPLLERLGQKLREHRDDRDGYLLKTACAPVTDVELELLSRLGFILDGEDYCKQLSRSEVCYLTGGWLEEFCFNEVASLIGNGIDDVAIGIKIMNNKKRDNEFDVMFTKDNALYTVECKSLDQNDDKKADALYKIAALQKEFGLRVKSFFVSTSPHIMRDGQLKQAIAARAEQFSTIVITPDEVAHFGQRLRENLNL